MTIAAAIVNWNSGERLHACIASLTPASGVAEIAVVDNASQDDSLSRASVFRDGVTFIRNSRNRGFAAALNQAFAATSSSLVLILNPDIRVTEGAVTHLNAVMASRARAAAVGGYVNEKYLPRRLPTPSRLISENLGIASRDVFDGGDETRPVEQPAAASLLVRRQAYDEVGGFDERFYPAWYEDVDFCRRLKSSGWDIYFAPRARFIHEGGYSARALGTAGFAEAYYRNQLRYAEKHFSRASAAAVRASITAGLFARMVARPAEARAYASVMAGALKRW